MELYSKFYKESLAQYKKFKSKYRIIGTIRLLVILGSIYCFYLFLSREQSSYLYIFFALIVVFIILMRIHTKVSWKMRFHKALMEINKEETEFLEDKKMPLDDGVEFNKANHPYSYDLDIFGPKSLFQFLNRASSFMGKSQLASMLNGVLTEPEILENQEAIKELSTQIEWRQKISALSRISPVASDSYSKIKKWASSISEGITPLRRILSFVVPALFFVSLVFCFISDNILWDYITSLLFTINLILTVSMVKHIQQEIQGADKIHETIDNCSLMIEQIEQSDFKSKKLKKYIANFKEKNASKELKELSNYFEKINTIANLFIFIAFNGIFQYHIHVLGGLLKWKKAKAASVVSWFDEIGEIEALNSLANYSYNNQDYTFPILNTEHKMFFKDLGHPLIDAKKRVTNDIDFSDQRFVILTGSNMSGKSTFLRTIGINLVMAGIGAPICSSEAMFFPMPIFVSMRLEDSLSDSESYFYAEVKRLKLIVNEVKTQPCFVLLDEILRGTNSDDKQSGTIGVILKLIKDQTYGMIATHDLEVCEITKDYPSILINKCFEVEMKNDELYFDYKIQDGICKNKNATFIMKKMGII